MMVRRQVNTIRDTCIALKSIELHDKRQITKDVQYKYKFHKEYDSYTVYLKHHPNPMLELHDVIFFKVFKIVPSIFI